MEIWTASLVLTTDEKCEIIQRFDFEKENKKYEVNKFYPDKEWVSKDRDWTFKRISKVMEVRRSYGTFIVEQGFDKELNEIELRNVEIEMKKFLTKHLQCEKERWIADYDMKIKAIESTL